MDDSEEDEVEEEEEEEKKEDKDKNDNDDDDNGEEEKPSYLISASPINSQYLSTMLHVTLAPFSIR